MITLKEAITKKEMKEFVKFPFKLYKKSKYWVPPIINDELEGFNKDENPAFKFSDARFFIAYKDNKPVGRVAAIINWKEVNDQEIKKMRFGWFDTIDDIEVTKALLNKVDEIGAENNLEFTEGPVGFTNLDKVGVLTEGYDHIGSMVTWYNHPYYKKHLESLGFEKAKEWNENYMYMKNAPQENHGRIAKIVSEKYKLRALDHKKTADVMEYADDMFDLLNQTYAHLASYVPISEEQKKYFKKKFIGLINPEYIINIVDENNKLIAFAVTMPSFAKALQKANGKLFPFGIFHLLHARKHSKEALFYLIGVDEKYKNKGVVALIFEQCRKVYEKRGVTKFIRTPELEENVNIQLLWKKMKPVNHKKRRTYKRVIK